MRIRMPTDSRRFVVLRDLRDSLVSAYFSVRYSHALVWGGMVELRAQLEALSVEEGMSLLAERWLPKVAAIQASWLGSHETIFRYEDLLSRDLEVLDEALNVRGSLGVDRATLRRVVEVNRFESLTGGRPAGEEDPLAHERKGIAGDWQNYFTAKLQKRVEDLYGPLLRAYLEPARAMAVPIAGGSRSTVAPRDVLRSHDIVSLLHPTSPTYSHWLAWEHAAFARFPISGRILDLGCSDVQFFDLVVPRSCEAVGACANPTLAELAALCGRYLEVSSVGDYENLAPESAFDHVFARGTLVLVPRLEAVLASVLRCLRPGGTLLCSVVTDRYEQWGLLARLFELAGFPADGAEVRRRHLNSHGICNAMPLEGWRASFEAAGLEVTTCIPIIPQFNAEANQLFDVLWHLPAPEGGEFGDAMAAHLSARPGFRSALRGVIRALMELESNWDDTAAAVYQLRKPT